MDTVSQSLIRFVERADYDITSIVIQIIAQSRIRFGRDRAGIVAWLSRMIRPAWNAKWFRDMSFESPVCMLHVRCIYRSFAKRSLKAMSQVIRVIFECAQLLLSNPAGPSL